MPKELSIRAQKRLSVNTMYYFDKMPQCIQHELDNGNYGWDVALVYKLWLRSGTKYTLEQLRKKPNDAK